MKRFLSLFISLVLLVVVISGCSSGPRGDVEGEVETGENEESAGNEANESSTDNTE